MGNDRLVYTFGGAWSNARMLNLSVEEQSVKFAKEESRQYGSFATGVLVTTAIESSEPDYGWGTILIDADIPKNSLIKVYCYASDYKMVEIDGAEVELDQYIMDKKASSFKERLHKLVPLFHLAFSGAVDGLVNVKGRYLWIMIEFLVPNSSKLLLHRVQVSLSHEKLIQYLPQIYRNQKDSDDFFGRFMDIFDSLFFDIEKKVEQLPTSLDYTVASGEMLRYLASWIGVGINDMPVRDMADEELRARMSVAVEEYKAIGTKKGVESLIKRELGVQPIIVEYFRVKKMVQEGRDRKLYHLLFGDNVYCFFLLLPEEAFLGKCDMQTFLHILRNNIPAYTKAKIILLKKRIVLGKHTYLGVNSVIRDYNYVGIDQNISISSGTIIGGN